MATKYLMYIGGGILAYLVIINVANAMKPNSNMGGLDFGVLDPSTW